MDNAVIQGTISGCGIGLIPISGLVGFGFIPPLGFLLFAIGVWLAYAGYKLHVREFRK